MTAVEESLVPPDAPLLRHAFTIQADLLPPVDAGDGAQGLRRIIPIAAGTVAGREISGKLLPGGADFQRVRSDGVTEIQARYIIETRDGYRVYVENTGLRRASPQAMAKLLAGAFVDPAEVYFRAVPRFEVQAGPHAWLERSIFLCVGARYPLSVRLDFFEVA